MSGRKGSVDKTEADGWFPGLLVIALVLLIADIVWGASTEAGGFSIDKFAHAAR